MTEKDIKDIQKYINEHLFESTATITDNLLKMCACSYSYFTHFYSEQSGEPLGVYIKHNKLDLAKKLIEQGNSPVEVGYKIGYESYSGFGKAFEKQHGIRPAKLYEKYAPGKKEKAPPKQYGVNCDGCVYWRRLNNSYDLKICHYLIDTGESKEGCEAENRIHYTTDPQARIDKMKKCAPIVVSSDGKVHTNTRK